MEVQQQQEVSAAAETDQTVDSSKQPQQEALCEECNLNPSKYKCPGCNMRTCSLTCVKSHKKRTSCTGKRDQTKFVPKSQFDDNLLLSDYNLLEDVKRVADSAQRRRVSLCGHHPQFRLPFPLKGLQNAAGRRGIKLLFLPTGMLKRKNNRTKYNQRKKSITWTIEWRFHSTNVVFLDHGVHENATLRSVIMKHLEPSPWKNELREFCDAELDNLKFFIRKYPKGPQSPFRELDVNASVSNQLSNIVILEYPVIHVFLPSHKCEFEVVKDLTPIPDKPVLKQPEEDNCQTSRGISFKEEEFDEDGSSEPLVLDLLDVSMRDVGPGNSHQARRAGKESNNKSSNNSCTTRLGEHDCDMDSNAQRVLGGDFDQDLMDIYSYLIDDGNPLGFDWESIDHSHNEFLPVNEDLEEGEIPGSS